MKRRPLWEDAGHTAQALGSGWLLKPLPPWSSRQALRQVVIYTVGKLTLPAVGHGPPRGLAGPRKH